MNIPIQEKFDNELILLYFQTLRHFHVLDYYFRMQIIHQSFFKYLKI